MSIWSDVLLGIAAVAGSVNGLLQSAWEVLWKDY